MGFSQHRFDDHPNSYDDKQCEDDHGDGEGDCGYGYEEDSEYSVQQIVVQ